MFKRHVRLPVLALLASLLLASACTAQSSDPPLIFPIFSSSSMSS